MCIRDSLNGMGTKGSSLAPFFARQLTNNILRDEAIHPEACLLYTSDAADERSSVDLGGRRIIKKNKTSKKANCATNKKEQEYTHSINKTQ